MAEIMLFLSLLKKHFGVHSLRVGRKLLRRANLVVRRLCLLELSFRRRQFKRLSVRGRMLVDLVGLDLVRSNLSRNLFDLPLL